VSSQRHCRIEQDIVQGLPVRVLIVAPESTSLTMT